MRPRHRPTAHRLALSVSLLLIIGCGHEATSTDAPEPVDRRPVVANRPSREARGYVGSAACVECHEDIADRYQGHSMGRSAFALDGSMALPRADQASFEADGYRYSVRKQGDQWVHHQGRIATDGGEVAAVDFVAKHAIGSGHHGQSFVVERDGYLFLSPITWYPDKQAWDFSPGFEDHNSQFNRPIVELCLYCHTNGASVAANTMNRYESPPIEGHAIGCERCHGPGKAHVEHQLGAIDGLNAVNGAENGAGDSTIVNPAKLDVALREAVCHQCHLTGVARITKPGKTISDYRPGQPLESAYTIFTQRLQRQGDRLVGHVEQLAESKCFQAADGLLGCISCHDPHGLPSRSERVAFYRAACLKCHTDQSCHESVEARRVETAEDSCIACHMPSKKTEVRHVAVTDHSIPRTPSGRVVKPDDTLRAFPSDELAKPTPRDQAIARVLVGLRQRDLLGPAERSQAQRALEKAIAGDRRDFAAHEALAELYLVVNNFAGAISVCRKVLTTAPDREQTLVILADTYSGIHDYAEAIPTWQRLIQVNPWMPRYWYRLGRDYAATQQWVVCREMANEAKQRFPTSIGVRQLLVQSNLALKDFAAASGEFRELERLNPNGIEALRRWYNNQTAGRTND